MPLAGLWHHERRDGPPSALSALVPASQVRRAQPRHAVPLAPSDAPPTATERGRAVTERAYLCTRLDDPSPDGATHAELRATELRDPSPYGSRRGRPESQIRSASRPCPHF